MNVLIACEERQRDAVKGRWVLDVNASKKHIEKIYYCSVCENWEAWGNPELTNYCPNCGAEMGKEDANNGEEKQ